MFGVLSENPPEGARCVSDVITNFKQLNIQVSFLKNQFFVIFRIKKQSYM